MQETNKNNPDSSVVKEMILWWEKKRIFFNALVISYSVYLIFIFWDYPMRSFKGTQIIIENAIFLIVFLNICYTASWLPAVIMNKLFKTRALETQGRWILFILGTLFALFLTNFHFVFEFDVLFAD